MRLPAAQTQWAAFRISATPGLNDDSSFVFLLLFLFFLTTADTDVRRFAAAPLEIASARVKTAVRAGDGQTEGTPTREDY